MPTPVLGSDSTTSLVDWSSSTGPEDSTGSAINDQAGKDFTSVLKSNRDPTKIDIPPPIPPRSQHLRTRLPSVDVIAPRGFIRVAPPVHPPQHVHKAPSQPVIRRISAPVSAKHVLSDVNNSQCTLSETLSVETSNMTVEDFPVKPIAKKRHRAPPADEETDLDLSVGNHLLHNEKSHPFHRESNLMEDSCDDGLSYVPQASEVISLNVLNKDLTSDDRGGGAAHFSLVEPKSSGYNDFQVKGGEEKDLREDFSGNIAIDFSMNPVTSVTDHSLKNSEPHLSPATESLPEKFHSDLPKSSEMSTTDDSAEPTKRSPNLSGLQKVSESRRFNCEPLNSGSEPSPGHPPARLNGPGVTHTKQFGGRSFVIDPSKFKKSQTQCVKSDNNSSGLDAPSTVVAPPRKRKPRVDQITVVGGYVKLPHSSLCRSRGGKLKKQLKVNFDEELLESVHEYPSEDFDEENLGERISHTLPSRRDSQVGRYTAKYLLGMKDEALQAEDDELDPV